MELKIFINLVILEKIVLLLVDKLKYRNKIRTRRVGS